MDTTSARNDLALVKDIVQRTSRRVDAHAFHCVHWGVIVLIWYPVANWLWQHSLVVPEAEKWTWIGAYIGVGVASVVLGTILSIVRGVKATRKPRLAGGNTFISNQLARIVFANLVAGGILSAVAPAHDASPFIRGENVPIIWGLVYANMAFMMGVAYSRDFMVAGVAIFAGCVAAIVFQDLNGYILGPCMGLGMIIPGLRAEARVRALAKSDHAADERATATG